MFPSVAVPTSMTMHRSLLIMLMRMVRMVMMTLVMKGTVTMMTESVMSGLY